MKNTMQHKGYIGAVNFDEKEPIFYGRVKFMKALISYEGENAKELLNAFHEAVDDYLVMCEKENIQPEKPFKGSLNIRIGEDLHRLVATKAAEKNMTLNQFISNAVGEVCGYKP